MWRWDEVEPDGSRDRVEVPPSTRSAASVIGNKLDIDSAAVRHGQRTSRAASFPFAPAVLKCFACVDVGSFVRRKELVVDAAPCA